MKLRVSEWFSKQLWEQAPFIFLFFIFFSEFIGEFIGEEYFTTVVI